MTDSDEDPLPSNIYTFENDNTTISARGPNVNTNITGLSFRNNVLTSTMHMPVNYDRQRYGGSNFDQRSMYCRRETSPMSLRSVPEYGAPNFSRSVYNYGMGSQRSMYNGRGGSSMYSGRGGSSMSVHSNDTTTSVSTADILFAFQNKRFNKYDLRLIKDAFNKYIKTRQRKRIEKRRNLKLFLKGTRRKSGEDSGEQGSDSSISSDDCRSVRTTICKENIPGLRQMRDLSHFNTNIPRDNERRNESCFTNNIQDFSMFTDRTENIKKNTLRNMFSVNSSTISNMKDGCNTNAPIQKNIPTVKDQSNISVMTQKERFTRGFLLPSQRFNKTIPGKTQVNNNKIQNMEKRNIAEVRKPSVESSDSDPEEFFHGFPVTQKETQVNPRKRSLENEDTCHINKKRNREDATCKTIRNGESNDFIFAKPKVPVKKVNAKKDKPEKLLAKSQVPPLAENININFEQSSKTSIEKDNIIATEDTEKDITNNSDVSMRPSFIKRKLFTQKLDVAEQKNISSDSLGVNSPKNIYSASMRERNKARKLITSQSCLSREIIGEDNNVLDLIHKIVTPDEINSTNIANKTETNNKSNDVENPGKWDVSTVIANCDNQDISDTYTDEEIFAVNQEKKIESKNDQQCKIVVQKLLPQTVTKLVKNNNTCQVPSKSTAKETNKKSVTDCVKSFWDTDFESDMEFNAAPTLKNNIQKNQETALRKGNKELGKKQIDNSKKIPKSKGTIMTVRDCHKSILNNSLKSHKTQSSDKIVEDKPNSVVEQEKDKASKKIQKTNLPSQTGKKKDNLKENVDVNMKSEVGRKPKAKQCVDCVKDNPKNTPKNENKNKKVMKKDNASNKKEDVLKNSPKRPNLRVQRPLKSKDCKNMEPKPTNKTKVTKSVQKSTAKIPKQPASNGRKRKSKDKSFTPPSSSIKTSIGNTSTIMTRSREKLSLSFSQDEYCMNLSNGSNRSLRLCDRIQRKIH